MNAPATPPKADTKPEYREETVDSWPELRALLEDEHYEAWAFRGQADAKWDLESSLTRYLNHAKVHKDHWEDQERRMLRIFRRKAHLHLSHLPNPHDSFQWLALMQHHGAPTRLLDFTWSPYVATFYALARPIAPETEHAAIWAVKQAKLNRRHEGKGPWVFGNYERYFLPNHHEIVLVGEPHHMNQRLVAHSATFAIPGRIDLTVDHLITSYIDKTAVEKIILKNVRQIRRDALNALYAMNITWATLFPGLDGLALSMGTEFEIHWEKDVTQPKPQTILRSAGRKLRRAVQWTWF